MPSDPPPRNARRPPGEDSGPVGEQAKRLRQRAVCERIVKPLHSNFICDSQIVIFRGLHYWTVVLGYGSNWVGEAGLRDNPNIDSEHTVDRRSTLRGELFDDEFLHPFVNGGPIRFLVEPGVGLSFVNLHFGVDALCRERASIRDRLFVRYTPVFCSV